MIVIIKNLNKQKSVKMPTLGNPLFNHEAVCQEQELIRWKSVVEDNLKINKIPDESKAAFIRGWIGDKVCTNSGHLIGQVMNGTQMIR